MQKQVQVTKRPNTCGLRGITAFSITTHYPLTLYSVFVKVMSPIWQVFVCHYRQLPSALPLKFSFIMQLSIVCPAIPHLG